MRTEIEAIIRSVQDLERKCDDLAQKHQQPNDDSHKEAKAIAQWCATKCNELLERYR
jgi:hypothetical protein